MAERWRARQIFGRRAPGLCLVVALGVSALVPAVLMAAPAGAATITVTTTLDGGSGSLRQAVADASGNGQANEIVLQGAQTYDLTCGAGGELAYPSNFALSIIGNGATIHQSCPGQRVLLAAGNGSLTLDGLTLTNGSPAGGGGAISAVASVTVTNATITKNTAAGGKGGGILTPGSVTVTNSIISDNSASDFGGAIDAGTATVTHSVLSHNVSAGGGGIGATGRVIVSDSTISENTGPAGGGGIGTTGSVTVTNSTIDHNSASGAGGVGAIGIIIVTNSTISNNVAGSIGGGGIFSDTSVELIYSTVVENGSGTPAKNVTTLGHLTAFGSVVARPKGGGSNCTKASSASNGYNFSDDTSCGFAGTGDLQNAGDPGLGPLASNGGPTRTQLPGATSPLHDTIPLAACAFDQITSDQRGFARPQGPGCDTGAVETDEPAPAQHATPTFTG